MTDLTPVEAAQQVVDALRHVRTDTYLESHDFRVQVDDALPIAEKLVEVVRAVEAWNYANGSSIVEFAAQRLLRDALAALSQPTEETR